MCECSEMCRRCCCAGGSVYVVVWGRLVLICNWRCVKVVVYVTGSGVFTVVG